eukprot:6184044-Pleurochrysis_carterae.AAC.3
MSRSLDFFDSHKSVAASKVYTEDPPVPARAKPARYAHPTHVCFYVRRRHHTANGSRACSSHAQFRECERPGADKSRSATVYRKVGGTRQQYDPSQVCKYEHASTHRSIRSAVPPSSHLLILLLLFARRRAQERQFVAKAGGSLLSVARATLRTARYL